MFAKQKIRHQSRCKVKKNKSLPFSLTQSKIEDVAATGSFKDTSPGIKYSMAVFKRFSSSVAPCFEYPGRLVRLYMLRSRWVIMGCWNLWWWRRMLSRIDFLPTESSPSHSGVLSLTLERHFLVCRDLMSALVRFSNIEAPILFRQAYFTQHILQAQSNYI